MSASPSKPIRYAIYTRQSVDGLRDFSSCQAQFLLCQEHIRNSGESNLTWIGSRLDDEGYSGATLDRPVMRKLRKIVDLGGVQRIYAVVLDRLTRNMRDGVILLAELEAAGVELRLVHQPQLTSGPQNRFCDTCWRRLRSSNET
jgi:site-specific DNA recombinase